MAMNRNSNHLASLANVQFGKQVCAQIYGKGILIRIYQKRFLQKNKHGTISNMYECTHLGKYHVYLDHSMNVRHYTIETMKTQNAISNSLNQEIVIIL